MAEKELQRIEFTREQIDLIKQTVAKGATDAELALFLYQAKRTGLDPLTRQIHFIKRKHKQPDGTYLDVGTIQTGIDGLRVIAERTGKYAGQLGPFWCGQDGKWMEAWLSPKPPYAAKVGVLREDFREPLWRIAKFESYAPRKKDGSLFEIWERMPEFMISKCCEAQALRAAFPQDLSGLYVDEEMVHEDTQASDEKPPDIPPPLSPQKNPISPVHIADVRVKTGKGKDGEWSIYTIIDEHGKSYATVSKTLAVQAKELKEKKIAVFLMSRTTEKYEELMEIRTSAPM